MTARPGIHVVCAADERFAIPLTVMVKSAAVNTRVRPLVFHVLAKSLGRGTRRRIIGSIQEPGVEVRFIPVPERTLLRRAVVSGHISSVTYYRLVVAHCLPPALDRVIYLDADVVVTADLGELWALDTAGHAFLAVSEDGIGEHLRPLLARLAPAHEDTTTFFNAGVLLIDLRQWRALKIGERALDSIDSGWIPMTFWDQDILNVVAAGAWGPLPRRWNLMGADEDGGGIVHFNAHVKPWHAASRHPHRALFFRYLEMTRWAGWRTAVWMRTDPAVRKLRRGWHYYRRRLRAFQ